MVVEIPPPHNTTFNLQGTRYRLMRYLINKRNSTKAERMVYEVLKELHIPFRHRWLVRGYEVDFLVGKTILEINGHDQDEERNNFFIKQGYKPYHLHNQEVLTTNLKEKILCLLQK